ncbi:MAG: EamA family transporter RarD [Rhodospirillaceae bacterium]|nr:EamA family transporter RarD [Rhodospirillaceae bacterium]
MPLNNHQPSPQPTPPPFWLGTTLALGAYTMWGLFPLYFKLLSHINYMEVLAQRTVWTFVFVFLIMLAMGRFEIFAREFYFKKTVLIMLVSGIALAINWGVFIVAVSIDQVLQASLGYFMAPLASALLGIFVLSERPNPARWVALGFALAGVSYMVASVGDVPWLALALAGSWALYGLMRKLSPLGSISGLYMETMILSPLALGYIFYIAYLPSGSGPMVAFGTNMQNTMLLIGAGILTALPLLLFARAAKLLQLGAIGILQYVVPTGQFMLAVFIFDEPFGSEKLITFVCIWIALAIYVADSLYSRRTSRKNRKK